MRGQVSNPCRARRLGAPSYRLGGLFRRRKGAGDSVERLSLVFRCRLFGGGRELGTPLFDSAFAAAGSSAAQGDGEHGEPLRFFVGPDALIGPFPGGPVCRPYEMRESSSLAVGADDLGGPRAHTVLPYVGKRAGSVGSEAAGAGIKPHQSQFSSRSDPQWGRTEWHPSTPGIARRKGRTTSKG